MRAPAPLDVGELLARRGPVEAHRDLEIRIIADPKDIAARLALAELDVQLERPGEALDELAWVEQHNGLLGIRWHDSDRERLATLVLARALERAQRDSPAALGDFEHAAKLGATVDPRNIADGKLALARTKLRHVDAGVRAAGRRLLAEGGMTAGDPATFGELAWAFGARREAYEQLAAWHAKPHEADSPFERAYLRALAWWSPPDVAPPKEATGPQRCWFVSAGCAPDEAQEPPREPSAATTAAARYALARVATPGATAKLVAGVGERALAPQLDDAVRAYRRDPAVGERLARDFIASSVDTAAAHATIGALFDALGDPARAREHWQAAVEASGEPSFWRGLAESTARGGDGPAALVFATTAAAAWGDPAVVWGGVARALDERGLYVDALTAAHSAIDLGDIESLPPALEVAVSAARALGRDDLVADFERQRARLPHAADRDEALAAVTALPNAVTTARAWVVSRERPRDAELRAMMLRGLPADDPRRPALEAELLALSSDPDPAIALAAARALR